MTDQSYYIPRKLTWIDDQQKQQVVGDNQVVSQFIQPMGILGTGILGTQYLIIQVDAMSGFATKQPVRLTGMNVWFGSDPEVRFLYFSDCYLNN